MAQLPRTLISDYDRVLSRISSETRKKLLAELQMVDFTDIAAAREVVIRIMQKYCGMSSQMAATVAAEFYDAVREAETGARIGARAIGSYDPDATAGAVRALIGKAKTPDGRERFIREMLDRMDYETKRSAGACVTRNGVGDKKYPRFARVPAGVETCDFCLMLASRGAVYHSKKAAGEFSHYHANCSCKVVPFFGNSTIEGYDPTEYYRQWRDSIDDQAKERAERNGTTVAEEKQKIKEKYARAAERAAEREKERRAKQAATA